MNKYKHRNYEELGRKIAYYRKKVFVLSAKGKQKPASQTELIQLMRSRDLATIGRNTLSDLENGVEAAFMGMTTAQWDSLCAIFGCDVGYLLGEYDCHDFSTQFIHDQIGLSEESVNILSELPSVCHNGVCVDREKDIWRCYPLNKMLDELLQLSILHSILYEFARYKDYEIRKKYFSKKSGEALGRGDMDEFSKQSANEKDAEHIRDVSKLRIQELLLMTFQQLDKEAQNNG